jgi:hypothetical protein
MSTQSSFSAFRSVTASSFAAIAAAFFSTAALASTTVEGNPFWEFSRPFDVQCEFKCPLGANLVERVTYVARSGAQFPNNTNQVLLCIGGRQTVAHTLPSPLTILIGTNLRCFVRYTHVFGAQNLRDSAVENEPSFDSSEFEDSASDN